MEKNYPVFHGLVILALAFCLLSPAAASGQSRSAVRADPALVQIRASSPRQTVRAIVQITGDSLQVIDLVQQMGGKIVWDLPIIRSITVEMEAGSALRLAACSAVRWVSLDAPVRSAKRPVPNYPTIPNTTAQNYYLDTLGVRQAWDLGLQGDGITVAVIDSGISNDADFISPGKDTNRVVFQKSFNSNSNSVNDFNGHGSHVAGIIGGDGRDSGGTYLGVAPGVNLIDLKVSSNNGGMATESDVVRAIQWIYENRTKYNIRVVNLSLNSTLEQSYHISPLDAAVEILWFNGVVVIASSGNRGSPIEYNTANAAPANDPFIITVGASDENRTSSRLDDFHAPFSAYGITLDGFTKPDILAPGKDIISVLSKNSAWVNQFPERVVGGGEYFRLSGTSMAAPMVAGAVALLLQAEPDLTPGQVKYRLINSASDVLSVDNGDSRKNSLEIPYLDVYRTVTESTTESENIGIMASKLLDTGSVPINSSVNWNSVNWNSVNWNSVNWNSAYWGE